MSLNLKYYIFHKPYGVLSQFTKEIPEHVTLRDYLQVNTDIYPVGRLDKDSEGLIILTNDKKLNQRLLDPANKHNRTYWIQVEGVPEEKDLDRIRKGTVQIRVKKKNHQCLPAQIKLLDHSLTIEERTVPIRFRKSISTCWIEIILQEGKNRQVRKMLAAIGYPVLRLIRVAIEDLQLGDISQGQYIVTDRKSLYSLLKLN